jgi:CO/xanthine dehydrogenase Mo-binding subunit
LNGLFAEALNKGEVERFRNDQEGMHHMDRIGGSFPRKDGLDKVSGAAKYTGDYTTSGILHVKIVMSPYAHAKIKSIDLSKAWEEAGVRAIITGHDFPFQVGEPIADRPPIAIDKVRYHGEPVALIVADHLHEAIRAAERVIVDYEILPAVNSPSDAIKENVPLVHEKLAEYKITEKGAVFPEPSTNIANRTKIRKGDIQKGWKESEVVVEGSISFPQSDHAAMETRCTMAEILPSGQVNIYSSSQSPFLIKKMIHTYFKIALEKVVVHTPLVGGAFGGKTPVQLEYLAFLASKAIGGRMVKLLNTREEDLIMSPVHIGLDAKVKLGCTKEGRLKAAEISYLFDGGAYADRAVIISKAAAVDCTGPYHIENVHCDSLCLYTNHPYAVAWRGFGHSELTFAMERAMDLLAGKLGMDPLKLRMINAIKPGHTTPTQTLLNANNLGDISQCLERLKEVIKWEEGQRKEIGDHKVIAKGVSCFWKTSNTSLNAGSGAILTFNADGSINLICGVVEIGQGTKTGLAQILAERMKMDVEQIHVMMEVDTQVSPEHWKTVASLGMFMAGRAVLSAAEDAIRQLKSVASQVLRTTPEDVEVGEGRVFLIHKPGVGIAISKVAMGYTYPGGNTIGSQVIGRGSYVLRHLTNLDPDTGKGNPGPEWTVGAQAVEVEMDTKEFTYKIRKAATVLDAGKVIHRKLAEGQMMGGMSLGLSFASRESFLFHSNGTIQNTQLRNYKIIRFGENPTYFVDFVETPNQEAPYGLRGIGEYGVIGMPAALANSLSLAARVNLNQLPLTPELIWKTKQGGAT